MYNMLIDDQALTSMQMRNPRPEVGEHRNEKEVKNSTGVPSTLAL